MEEKKLQEGNKTRGGQKRGLSESKKTTRWSPNVDTGERTKRGQGKKTAGASSGEDKPHRNAEIKRAAGKYMALNEE